MSTYHVVLRSYNDRKYLHSFDFKIKHHRNSKGKEISPLGGATYLFDLSNGLIYSAKCRNDETFSKKKGILTCLQKMLNCSVMKDLGVDLSQGSDIAFASFDNVGALVDVAELAEESKFYWLQK